MALSYGGRFEKYAKNIGLDSDLRMARILHIPLPFYFISLGILSYFLIKETTTIEIIFLVASINIMITILLTACWVGMPIVKGKRQTQLCNVIQPS